MPDAIGSARSPSFERSFAIEIEGSESWNSHLPRPVDTGDATDTRGLKGGWIGPAAVVVLSTLVVLAFRFVLHRVRCAVRRREVRAFAARRTPLAEGKVALRGVLRGDAVAAPIATDAEVATVDIEAGTT